MLEKVVPMRNAIPAEKVTMKERNRILLINVSGKQLRMALNTSLIRTLVRSINPKVALLVTDEKRDKILFSKRNKSFIVNRLKDNSFQLFSSFLFQLYILSSASLGIYLSALFWALTKAYPKPKESCPNGQRGCLQIKKFIS